MCLGGTYNFTGGRRKLSSVLLKGSFESNFGIGLQRQYAVGA